MHDFNCILCPIHLLSCVICAGQTDSGSRAISNGGLGASNESAKQLELPHIQLNGENQWEMWTDPQSGEHIPEHR